MSRGRRSRDRGYISGNRVTSAPTYDEVIVNYLVVAGGGGAGGNVGGGGGAGGLRSTITATGGGGSLESALILLTGTNHTIVIGSGGSGGVNETSGTSGQNSIFSTITSIGGGHGGSRTAGASSAFGNGGSGGGAGGSTSGAVTGGAGTVNQGFAAGNAVIGATSNTGGGGGGGAGSVGGNAGSGQAGNGGTGVASSITGSSVFYASGGGAGGLITSGGTRGTASPGGGGNGVNGGTGTAGTANTGGGGGGGSDLQTGGAGGSGVVILRYSNLYTLNIGAGLSYSTQTVNDDKVTTFTSGSGSISLSPAPVTTGDYESIATVLVGSAGASTVTFSNIPQTYKHLQVRLLTKESGTGTGGPNIVASLNSDTTHTNYRSHYLTGDGAAAAAGSVQAGGYYCLVGNTATSNAGYTSMFGVMVLDVLDYANTSKYKTLRALWGHDRNGSGEVGIDSSVWMNTAATTSISFSIAGGTNFVQHSHFALYGIRG